MAEFLTELDAHLLDDDTIWELNAPLLYRSDYLKFPVEVPKGFQSDFASIPRIPIVYTMFGDRAHRESVIHDYLYRRNSDPVVPKELADKIFYEAMEVRKKPWHIRYPIYWGVLIGGGASYHRRSVEDKLCF